MTSPVYGFQGQLGISSANPTTNRFDFVSSTLGVDEEYVDASGLRGTRAHNVERNIQGIRHVHGQLKLRPTAVELSELLQYCLGGSPSGSGTVTYPLAETVPTWTVQVDKVIKVATYANTALDKLTVRGSQGAPLEFDLDVIAEDESIGASGTFPVLTLDTANTPFSFWQGVLVVNSITYLVKEFEFTLDNALDKERFWNSQTLTALVATDRHIGLKATLAAGDAWAIYGTGAAGLSGTFTFTNGGAVLTFTFGKLAAPRKPVAVERSEILLSQEFTAFKTGSTLELVTTLNNGP